VKAELSVAYADAAEFAYLSAWRKGEILPLRWDAVDRAAGEIRLKTSKNGRGRVIPLEGELRDLVAGAGSLASTPTRTT
jgi:integrase